MALLTVVLIAALIFVSIVGIAARVVPENKMIASRSASERALTAAEAGLSQVLFNLRNTDFTSPGTTVPVGMATDSPLRYLTFTNVLDIARASGPYPETFPAEDQSYTSSPVPGGGTTPYVTYQVKIQKMPGSSSSSTQMPAMGLRIYSLGTVSDKINGTVLARKAIVLDVSIAYTTSTVIKAAMLAGDTVKFNGNGNRVVAGDAWTGGDITKGGTAGSFIIQDPGTAYATGSIDDGVAAKSVTHATSPSSELDAVISKLESAYSKVSADAFMNGNYPYNGQPGYPDTSLVKTDPTIQSIFVYYLGVNTNFARVASFYPDLKNGTIYNPGTGSKTTGIDDFSSQAVRDCLTSLRTFTTAANGNKIVVYYDGSASPSDVTDNMLASAGVGGTLVINDNFSMNGGTVNYSASTFPVGVNPLTLRVMGTVDLKGNGVLVANIFASGESSTKNPEVSVDGTGGNNSTFKFAGFLVTTEDAKIGGNVNIYGTVAADSTLDVGGNNTITYVDSGLGTIEGPLTPTVAAVQSSWKEVSFDKFNNPQ